MKKQILGLSFIFFGFILSNMEYYPIPLPVLEYLSNREFAIIFGAIGIIIEIVDIWKERKQKSK